MFRAAVKMSRLLFEITNTLAVPSTFQFDIHPLASGTHISVLEWPNLFLPVRHSHFDQSLESVLGTFKGRVRVSRKMIDNTWKKQH